MYSYKVINGKEYVIHDKTGCSLPYHSKKKMYDEGVPDWKYDYFVAWIRVYSNAMRKNVKKMSYTASIYSEPSPAVTSVTSVPSGFNWVTSYGNTSYPTISFAPLTTNVAVPADDCCKKEEGNTPMRNYHDTLAVAAISNPKSDESIQRDYLLSRLQSAEYPKREELTKVFNLYVCNTPKTYKELIAAIKDGKYTLDAKRTARIDARMADQDEDEMMCYGNTDPFDGILWDGPQSDPKGYRAACEDLYKQQTAAKDTIMTGDATAGLKALQDFEAWLPEIGTKAN